MFKQVSQWVNQNIIGISPPPEFGTWTQLAAYAEWGSIPDSPEGDRAKEAIRQRVEKEFDDETTLMLATFNKFLGLLTPVGVAAGILAPVVRGWKGFIFLLIAAAVVVLAVWGLSTRFKVMRKAKDTTPNAIKVPTGEMHDNKPVYFKPMDQIAATVWWFYTWKSHRYHTRLAIDRMFFVASILTATGVTTLIIWLAPFITTR